MQDRQLILRGKRLVTFEEVSEEKRQKQGKWYTLVRTLFYTPLIPEKFAACCQSVVTAMQHKMENTPRSETSRSRHDWKCIWSPWQSYGGRVQLWGYLQLESGCQKASFWGMFAKGSICGSISQRVELFDSIVVFKLWLADSAKSANEFEKCMRDCLEKTWKVMNCLNNN